MVKTGARWRRWGGIINGPARRSDEGAALIEPPDMRTPTEHELHFEQLGEERVRWQLGQWNIKLQEQAWAWLARKRLETAARDEALRLEQTAIARRTLRWAFIAGLVACIGVLVSLGAWLFPRG